MKSLLIMSMDAGYPMPEETIKQLMSDKTMSLIDKDGDDYQDGLMIEGTLAQIVQHITISLIRDGEFGGFHLMPVEEAEEVFRENQSINLENE